MLKGCVIWLLNVAKLLLETFFETKTTALPYGSIKFSFQSGRSFEKNDDFQLLISGQMPFERCKGANRVLSSPLIGLNSKSKNENEKLEAP